MLTAALAECSTLAARLADQDRETGLRLELRLRQHSDLVPRQNNTTILTIIIDNFCIALSVSAVHNNR